MRPRGEWYAVRGSMSASGGIARFLEGMEYLVSIDHVGVVIDVHGFLGHVNGGAIDSVEGAERLLHGTLTVIARDVGHCEGLLHASS